MQRATIMRGVEWALFFATTVYGHVAMKFAVDGHRRLVDAGLSLWGVSAVAAWGASSLLWMSLLQRDTLFHATTVSSLRYALTVAAAYAVSRATPSWSQLAGAALVVAGVYLAGDG